MEWGREAPGAKVSFYVKKFVRGVLLGLQVVRSPLISKNRDISLISYAQKIIILILLLCFLFYKKTILEYFEGFIYPIIDSNYKIINYFSNKLPNFPNFDYSFSNFLTLILKNTLFFKNHSDYDCQIF